MSISIIETSSWNLTVNDSDSGSRSPASDSTVWLSTREYSNDQDKNEEIELASRINQQNAVEEAITRVCAILIFAMILVSFVALVVWGASEAASAVADWDFKETVERLSGLRPTG